MRSGTKKGPEPDKPLRIKSVPPPKTPPSIGEKEILALHQELGARLEEYYAQTPYDPSKFVITKGNYPPPPRRNPGTSSAEEVHHKTLAYYRKRGTSHMLGGGLPNYNTCFLLLAILLLLAVLITYSI